MKLTKEQKAELAEKLTSSWASGKAAIAHLCRVCESVEIAPPKDATS